MKHGFSGKCSFKSELWWSTVPARKLGYTFVSPPERQSRRMLSSSLLSSCPPPPPVSVVSDAVLKPYALLDSSRILLFCSIPAVQHWQQTPSHPHLPAASCVGSKYLHSLSSQVARWRGLNVLGYVKSSPCIFNRLKVEVFF